MKRVYQIMSNFMKYVLDNMAIQVIVTILFLLAMLVTNTNDATMNLDTFADDVEQQVPVSGEEAVLISNDDVPRSSFSHNVLYLDEDYSEVYPYLLDKVAMSTGTESIELSNLKPIGDNITTYDLVSSYVHKYYYLMLNGGFTHYFNNSCLAEEVTSCFSSLFSSPFTWRRARAPGGFTMYNTL